MALKKQSDHLKHLHKKKKKINHIFAAVCFLIELFIFCVNGRKYQIES